MRIFGIECWPTFFSCCLLKQQSRRHSTTGSAWSPVGNADLISQRNVLASVQQVNNKQRTGKTCTPCLQTDLRGRCALCFVASRCLQYVNGLRRYTAVSYGAYMYFSVNSEHREKCINTFLYSPARVEDGPHVTARVLKKTRKEEGGQGIQVWVRRIP